MGMGGGGGGGMPWGAIIQGVTEMGKTSAAMVQQRRAQKHATQAFKHRYRWSMNDMRKAGLNPILAHGGNPGVAQTISPVAIQAGGGIGQALEQGLRRKDELAKVRAEEKRAQSATDVLRNERSLRGQQNRTEEWRTMEQKYRADEQKIRAELAEWGAHSARVVGQWDRSTTGETAAITRRAAETLGAAVRPVAEVFRGLGPLKRFGGY